MGIFLLTAGSISHKGGGGEHVQNQDSSEDVPSTEHNLSVHEGIKPKQIRQIKKKGRKKIGSRRIWLNVSTRTLPQLLIKTKEGTILE